MHSFVSSSLSNDALPISVTLFEKDKMLMPDEGAGFLLNGGLAVLGRINEDVQRAVYEAGHPVKGISGRIVTNGKCEEVIKINFQEVVTSSPEIEQDFVKDDGSIMFSFMKRGACQEGFVQLPSRGWQT